MRQLRSRGPVLSAPYGARRFLTRAVGCWVDPRGDQVLMRLMALGAF